MFPPIGILCQLAEGIIQPALAEKLGLDSSKLNNTSAKRKEEEGDQHFIPIPFHQEKKES